MIIATSILCFVRLLALIYLGKGSNLTKTFEAAKIKEMSTMKMPKIMSFFG